MNKVDIIVTTFNRADLFKRTMDSFLQNTDMNMINKVIISNDGSTDKTKTVITNFKKKCPVPVEVLPDENKRMGIIPRFNQAHALCKSKIICEFQDDVVFNARWLEIQMGYLNTRNVQFITGYDAIEHRDFNRLNNHVVIKHSSRFTQLLAYKVIWDKFFPMKVMHPFPTPSNGIGSKIDINLSYGRKNPARARTIFLCIPGLVDHVAEHNGSTWREGFNNSLYRGGLKPDNVQRYWRNRFLKQRDIAVGWAGKPKTVQEQIIKTKQDFIDKHIDREKLTLDYGCGVGLFSHLFDPRLYVGVDITADFIKMAKQHNPVYEYRLLNSYCLKGMNFNNVEQFMTINVLQHNCDYIVSEIFSSLRDSRKKGMTILLYENTCKKNSTEHMCFRSEKDYVKIISQYFNIKSSHYRSHVVHDEEHTLIQVKV